MKRKLNDHAMGRVLGGKGRGNRGSTFSLEFILKLIINKRAIRIVLWLFLLWVLGKAALSSKFFWPPLSDFSGSAPACDRKQKFIS